MPYGQDLKTVPKLIVVRALSLAHNKGHAGGGPILRTPDNGSRSPMSQLAV